MKHKYLLLLFFLCVTMHGQITNLSKLSKGRFYSSDVIKDENNNIRGYFLLFEADKVAKETVELEYVVLDENLTKVTNGLITEMKYESWLVDAQRIAVSTSLYKNKLLLRLADQANGVQFFTRYRILDVKSNEMSKAFIFNKDSLKIDPVFSRKNSEWSNNESENIYFFDGVGMVVDSQKMSKKKGITKRFLARYDDNFKQVWQYVYDGVEDKRLQSLRHLDSDKDVIVMFSRATKNNANLTYIPEVSLLFLDSQKGTLIKAFDYPELDKLSYRVVDCNITGDKIYVMGDYSKKSDTGTIDDTENIGLYSFVFDKATGKLLDSNYLKWENMAGKLDINKKGKVKKEGLFYTHNMLLKDDGNIIVVGETFLQSPITTNNMYFFELDSKLKVKEVFEVSKFRNKFAGTAAHSTDIKRYGLFDFIDYQKLGDDEYLFLLNDNEKKSSKKKKSTLYGIVSYADGKFKRQTLDLKTETSTIYAYNSKKGYVMLIENFDDDKPTEMRLEKINY